MNVSIIGTGYVGLVTGACLAERGHQVVCVDVDAGKVAAINAGQAPIHEAGLPELLERHRGSRLRASTDLAQAVQGSEITLIAVGTPAVEGRIDLSWVVRAAEQVGAAIRGRPGRHVVAVKSTVIPGSTDGAVRDAIERGSGLAAGEGFGLGMNPEFLTEGQAVADFMNPDRIVIGGVDERTHRALAALYEGFAGVPIVRTNNATAEMIKYASNCTLAAMISFSNELARLAERIGGVDIADVMRGVHQSAYFTSRLPGGDTVRAPITAFLEAGCGFGGSCLPKDVTALVAQGRSLGLSMPMLSSVLEINATQPDLLVDHLQRHFPVLRGVRVAVLGLAFKPDTDDTRESPAFALLQRLHALGAQLSIYDPVARAPGHPALRGVRVDSSMRATVVDAQAVVLVTRWREFAELGATLDALGIAPLVVDGRRILDPGAFERYEGIGRRAVPIQDVRGASR